MSGWLVGYLAGPLSIAGLAVLSIARRMSCRCQSDVTWGRIHECDRCRARDDRREARRRARRAWARRWLSACSCETEVVWGVGYRVTDPDCPRHGSHAPVEVPRARTVRHRNTH